MSRERIESFNVVPGNFCNFHCNHCVNNSGPHQREKLTSDEVKSVISTINNCRPPLIIFTGGEPSLHLPIINEIIGGLDYDDYKIQITTNGWFAKSDATMARLLSKFLKLDQIQLSYDKYHGSKLDLEDIQRLVNECARQAIGFNVTMCISSPLDLVDADQISKKLGIKISYQRVAAVGRARKSGVEYKQKKFDSRILKTRCPNLGTITYVHGKGYSFCCGPLVFGEVPIAHRSLAMHEASDIRKQHLDKTFGNLLDEAGIPETELTGSMSHPCVLCEYIHTRGQHVEAE